MFVRLLAPWFSIVALSGLAGFGIDQALVKASTGVVSQTPTTIDVHDNAALVDTAILQRSGSAVDATAASSSWTVVTITAVDMATGAERRQVQCVIRGDRVASDALLVDPKDFSAVVGGLCK